MSIPGIKFKEEKTKFNKENLPLLYEKEMNGEEDIIIKDLTQNKDLSYKHEPESGFGHVKSPYKKDPLKNEDLQIEMSDEVRDVGTIYEEEAADIRNIFSNLEPLAVIFNTYILGEDKRNEKIYFIDQHAAHERIMYEKYLNEFNNESIVSQQLINSEIINLTSIEMDKFLVNIDVFEKLGFDANEFGTNSVAIRSVPLIFGKPNIKSLFYDILDNLDNNIESSYDTKIDKIMKLACVNAIRGGDKMSEAEILSLFHQLKKTKNPNSCPHGRPTILKMDKKDIEKAFLRI